MANEQTDRDIDAAIAAIAVGGTVRDESPYYSTNISEAWALVYELRIVHRCRITIDSGPEEATVIITRPDGRAFESTEGMTSAALAKAYLAARTTE